jgi:hypothetical protein
MTWRDPSLLKHTVTRSRYRRAVERGHRGLRFERGLERRFREYLLHANLLRMRFAGYLGLLLFAGFAIVDALTLPPRVWAWTVPLRLGVIVPAFIAAIAVSHVPRWQRWLPHAALAALTIMGVGTVAVIAVGLAMASPIPYEGLLLVVMSIYLVSGLRWRPALLANAITLLALLAVQALWQQDRLAGFYQIVYALTANALGAYGGYILEYTQRSTFLANGLLGELAERDELTGLCNRRALNTHLATVMRQAARDRGVVAIAMVDVDHFKRFKDR